MVSDTVGKGKVVGLRVHSFSYARYINSRARMYSNMSTENNITLYIIMASSIYVLLIKHVTIYKIKIVPTFI
jgi:hypothetical protein